MAGQVNRPEIRKIVSKCKESVYIIRVLAFGYFDWRCRDGRFRLAGRTHLIFESQMSNFFFRTNPAGGLI